MNTATEKNNTEQTIAEVRRQKAAAYQAARGPNVLHSERPSKTDELENSNRCGSSWRQSLTAIMQLVVGVLLLLFTPFPVGILICWCFLIGFNEWSKTTCE